MHAKSFRSALLASLLALLSTAAAAAQSSSLLGLWREAAGSILDIHTCGADLCATLASVSPGAPSRVDGNNPNAAQRSRPLCGLQIGWGFHPDGPSGAKDGMIYDPRTGSSYHATLVVKGDALELHSYVGLKIFGRTETFTRVPQAPPCHTS
jgi:uncharacterized protein (DUF2147 family)